MTPPCHYCPRPSSPDYSDDAEPMCGHCARQFAAHVLDDLCRQTPTYMVAELLRNERAIERKTEAA